MLTLIVDEPGLEFGERCVGLARHLGAEGIVMRGELRLGAARPRRRARLLPCGVIMTPLLVS
jgi:hypothetical protein